jgi:phage gpG-like protein
VRLDLETFGEKQFSREILRVSRNADNLLRDSADEIHNIFLDTEERQFATQGGAFSGGWRPLAPSTRARKARLRLDPRIMHATLRLRNSLTQRGHADHVFSVTADELFIGTNVPYAGVHQNPRTSPLPRRRPVEFSESVRSDILKVLQRNLLGGGR